MKKPKQVLRNKDELIADLKKNDQFMRKMKFAREEFYPALCKASSSIDDAQMFLSSFNTMVMQEFLELMKQKKLADLMLEDKLDKNAPQYNEIIQLVHLFDDMSVFDVKDQVEGMRNEISLFITEENKGRKLEDLKTTWLDQM